MSLVVVIGLVLAISGTAYAVIAALRSGWEATVKEHAKDSKEWFEELDRAKNPAITEGRDKHRGRLKRGMATWNGAQWAPMLFLGLVSLLITTDVLFLDWTVEEKLIFSRRPECWCSLYKWGLVLTIVVDVIAIGCTFRSYKGICDAADEIARIFRVSISETTRAATDQPVQVAVLPDAPLLPEAAAGG